ncbi:hypothetical protein GIB67_036904 [Kingdonia uniflora]|uniref:Uncharacterized protein n=1 Tax=Kingdonia uniflora TaxID=39325 RepID=A0A7J7NVN4_9MAGN|nr:hypothetical protein GIB67_036904 [Kingdonia uniflora]
MRGLRVLGLRRQLLIGVRLSRPTRPFCTNSNNANKANTSANNATGVEKSERALDVYSQVNNLDFATATKILFSAPTKEHKFGIDFHLVQFFFALMPSLAIYLVAKYSRYRMRLLEEEKQKIRQKAEEVVKAEKAKEKALADKEMAYHPALLKLNDRLDKLEETIQDIVLKSIVKSTEDKEDSKKLVSETKPSSAPEPSSNEGNEKRPVLATDASPDTTERKEDGKSENRGDTKK